MTVSISAGTTPRSATIGHLRDLRAALEQQRTFRREQLAELDLAPRGATTEARDEVSEVLRRGAAAALTDIDSALTRLDTGHYGACETCGSTIPLERLEILPAASQCMACARQRYPSGTAGSR